MSAAEIAQKTAEIYKTIRQVSFGLFTWLTAKEVAGKITTVTLKGALSMDEGDLMKKIIYGLLVAIALLLVAFFSLYRYYKKQRDLNKKIIIDKQNHIEGLEKQLLKKRTSSKLSKDGATKAGDE